MAISGEGIDEGISGGDHLELLPVELVICLACLRDALRPQESVRGASISFSLIIVRGDAQSAAFQRDRAGLVGLGEGDNHVLLVLTLALQELEQVLGGLRLLDLAGYRQAIVTAVKLGGTIDLSLPTVKMDLGSSQGTEMTSEKGHILLAPQRPPALTRLATQSPL